MIFPVYHPNLLQKVSRGQQQVIYQTTERRKDRVAEIDNF